MHVAQFSTFSKNCLMKYFLGLTQSLNCLDICTVICPVDSQGDSQFYIYALPNNIIQLPSAIFIWLIKYLHVLSDLIRQFSQFFMLEARYDFDLKTHNIFMMSELSDHPSGIVLRQALLNVYIVYCLTLRRYSN